MSSVRIASFNLKHDFFLARHNRWRDRRELVRRIILEAGPAIVGVQELMPAMREDLRRLLREYNVFGFGRSRDLGNEESAILVRSADNVVCYDKTFWLSHHPEKRGSRAFFAVFPRICTVCEVEVGSLGRRIRIFNTHFDHICGPARTLGARVILEYMHRLNQKEPLPMVLMGDLNAAPDSLPVRILSENLHRYPDIRLHNLYDYLDRSRVTGTYHGFSGISRRSPIDYIFFTDDFQVENAYIDTGSVDGRYPSDHFPLVAELSLKE
ncbi:MAG: endonuclease/exonuclease/phosphatase family protein [Oscillospiraceae bacterium]|nr:endonuclease/exonuclease/phosphatase family protein [Oscillospiraceae bacterium]